ncbi:unnamed protein product [Orchesella dallaii]|uniref:ascorbate ferrireductase (transmembrane) n=1 Tax=Orchesella dallaii TaxID=48710 RepID=A0ABP1S139_9HEXA
MELKVGVSKFWIICNLLLMVDSLHQPSIQYCNKLMENSLPERCAYKGGDIYDTGRFCDVELEPHHSSQPASPSRQCCYQKSAGSPDFNKAYWFQVYDRRHGNYEPQNTLRYLDETLAQEGRSFCIVGEHFYQTQFIHWKNFKMFMPLAGRFFDIGNHIDPLDSRLMNTFIPFDTDNLFRRRGKGFRNTLKTPQMKADFKEVYCGTRTHPNFAYNGHFHSAWRYCGNRNSEFPYDTLQDKNDERYKKRPPMISEGMTDGCKNPYKVKVTRIEVDELQMKNYLHIKVYSDDVTTPPAGGKCPTGKMKYIMLEVRDQDGFPVGQFTNEIPCDTDHNKETLSCPPSTRPCTPVYGSKKNFMPCMFSHHLATEAPMIFLAGVETSSTPAGNATGGGGAGPGVPGGGEGGSYFTEVHATWRFAQMSSHFITELHFATMIIEDEKPIRYYTSRMTDWEGVRMCGHWPRRLSYNPNNAGPNCCERSCDWCRRRDHAAGYISTEYGFFRGYTQCITGANSQSTVPTNENYHCGLTQFCSINYHVNGTNNTDRPYGFSAQYYAIKLKKDSLGGWDYFRKGFIRDSDVNCHKDIPEIDPYFELISSYYHGNQYARLPVRRKMFLNERYRDVDGLNKGELTDYMTPGRNAFDGSIGCRKSGKYIKNWVYLTREPHQGVQRALKDVWNDPVVVQTYYGVDPRITEYFGTKYTKQGDPAPGPIPQQWRDLTLSLTDMVEQDKTRCPCPFVPTTEAPELMTKAPVEVHARHLHVINMLIAWVVLVPLGYFVARYYKETFSKVFFLQEFWWYTIHVLALLTALLFMLGSFYAMHLRRKDTGYKILWTDATTIHIYFGYSLVGVYVIHVLLGAFRAWDLYIREMQIWLHWGVGWAEYFLAAATIISAAAIPQGLFNCESFYIYVAFLVVQFLFFALMENHMRRVDNDQLHLTPPRPYFPVPMMRIFHKDAPGSFFRIVVLIVFFLVSIGFYAALHISTIQKPVSCFQKMS